jgi:hypothetical protein
MAENSLIQMMRGDSSSGQLNRDKFSCHSATVSLWPFFGNKVEAGEKTIFYEYEDYLLNGGG